MTEYGIWSDEGGGFVEDGFGSIVTAEAALAGYRRDDPTARIRETCPDHPDEPADACEDCLADACEDCGAQKADNPSGIVGDDKCWHCRNRADEDEEGEE